MPKSVSQLETFLVQPFGEGLPTEVHRHELAQVVEARAEELADMIQKEMKRSGYDGLLRAGVVLTGGGAQLEGLREVLTDRLEMPVRFAKPERLTGMADTLRSPSFSTSVGLLRLGLNMTPAAAADPRTNGGPSTGTKISAWLGDFFKRMLPGEQ